MPDIEVVYATSATQMVIALSVEAGSTLLQAIEQSCIQHHFPEIDLSYHRVGIFGELKALSDIVKEGK